MIEPGQAEDIVRNCIHEVADTNEEYRANKPLGKFAIIADEVVDDFRSEILENRRVGVPAFDHILDPAELDDINEDTLAGEVENIIMDKAIPVETDTAALVAKKSKKKKTPKPKKKGVKL